MFFFFSCVQIEISTGKYTKYEDEVAASYVIDVLMEDYYMTSPVEDSGKLSDYNFANWEFPVFSSATDGIYESFYYLRGNMTTRVTEFEEELAIYSTRTYNYGMGFDTQMVSGFHTK